MFVFPWPWFTPMQYLFSIGHDLHPHIFFRLWVSCPCISAFPVVTLLIFIYNWMYLSNSSVGFTAGQGNILLLVMYCFGGVDGAIVTVVRNEHDDPI